MTNLDNTELESCEQSADFVEAINMQTDEQLLDSLGTYLSIADQQGYTVRGIDENFEFSVAGDSITTISDIESHKTQGHYDILKTLNISILNPTDTTILRNQFSQFQDDSHSKAVYQNEIQNCWIPISQNLQPKVFEPANGSRLRWVSCEIIREAEDNWRWNCELRNTGN